MFMDFRKILDFKKCYKFLKKHEFLKDVTKFYFFMGLKKITNFKNIREL